MTHETNEYEICARCGWDSDDPKLPATCWGGEPHLWEITHWADAIAVEEEL